MRRRVVLATVLLGCAQTVSGAAPDGDEGSACRGVTPASLARDGLAVAPGVYSFRLVRSRDPRLRFATTEACPAVLNDPALLRWVPPRDGAVFVEDLRARGLLVWVLDDCTSAPRTCLRTQSALAERSFAVFAGRPVTLAIAPLGVADDPATGLADLEQVAVRLVIRELARPYAPCEIVAPEGGAMCDEGARCEGVCLPHGEVGASCGAAPECAPGLWCVGGRCALPRLASASVPCDANTPCGPGVWCVSGRCVREVPDGATCDADVACAATRACIAGRCRVPIPRGGDCADAPQSCAPGTRCVRTAEGTRCLDLSAPRCDASTPCAPGARCVDGRCATDGVCISAQTYPRAPCGAAAGCVEPAPGASPLAAPRCVRDGTTEGFCRAAGTPCDPGAACSIGRCVTVVGDGARCDPSRALCGPGLRCGPVGRCAPDGAPGAEGGVCLPGLRCAEGSRCDHLWGECVRTVGSGEACESTASCPQAEHCDRDTRRCRAQGGRGAACLYDESCAAPWACVARRCVEAPPAMVRREGMPCASPADRRAGRCVDGACRFALPPGARGEGGGACVEGFACGPIDGVRRGLPIGN